MMLISLLIAPSIALARPARLDYLRYSSAYRCKKMMEIDSDATIPQGRLLHRIRRCSARIDREEHTRRLEERVKALQALYAEQKLRKNRAQ